MSPAGCAVPHVPGGAAELLRLAWPLILANSFWALQIFLERVLLGWAGGDQVGAALATAILFWTPMSLFQNTSNYATTFVAQYTGAGRPRRVGPVVWQSLYFSVAGGVLFVAMAPAAETLVGWAGHSPHLQVLEAPYFRCLCFAAPSFLLVASAASFFAGRGDSRAVLLVNAVGLAVNAVCALDADLWPVRLPAPGHRRGGLGHRGRWFHVGAAVAGAAVPTTIPGRIRHAWPDGVSTRRCSPG